MTDFKDRFVIDGKRMDADVAGRILSAVQTRTVEGASSLVLRLDDRDRAILRSGVLTAPLKPSKKQQEIEAVDQAAWDKFAPARAVLDGWFVRLAGVSFEDESGVLTVTFEDEIATLMRRQTKAHKSTRHDKKKSDFGTTRAGFIHTLLFLSVYKTDHGRVLGTNTATSRWFSPEEDADQSAKEPAKDVVRSKGLPKDAKLTIKGYAIDAAQRKNLTAALAVADELLASDTATLAMLCSGIGESTWRDVVNSIGFGGVLQGQVATSGPTYGQNWFANMSAEKRSAEEAESFLKGGRGYQGGGAISLAKDPDLTPGEIATKVEGGGAAANFYGQWQPEAEKILSAWGGVSQTIRTRRKYSFRAGGMRQHQQHNYWDDAGDLAREVNWRLFADQNILFYVSDNWLFGRQATITVDPDDAAVTSVSFDADIGKPIAEVIVQASSPRWTGAPGAGVQVTKMGPVNGKWLLHEHVHDLYTGDDTYTLRRPSPKFKEPAPAVKSRTVAAGTQVKDSHLVYPLAEHGTDLGGVAAHGARAWGNWQSDNAVDIGVPIGTDVYAVDDGTVTRLGGSWDGTGNSNPNGFNVTLTTKSNAWFYTHMKHRVPLTIGQKVKAGKLFGQSGAANGVQHLHIASEKGDPEKLLGVKDT